MKKIFLSVVATVTLLMLCSCSTETNPLLQEWNTPFGVPPFEKVKPEHYMPAVKIAMEQHNAEINAIVTNTEAPSFENTIIALDNAGELLTKVMLVLNSDSNVKSNDAIMAVEMELTPLLSIHINEINLNEALFLRVKDVYNKRNDLGLDKDQLRLVEETFKGFERSGANLPADKKEELKAVNSELSSLELAFEQNVLKETAAFKLIVSDKESLSGLPESLINDAASRAIAASDSGKWYFGLDNPSVMPFLQYSDNAKLRKEMMDAYLNRCNNHKDNDNNAVIIGLISNRLKKAQIMGYNNYAEYILEERMAKNPKAVYELLDQLWTPALKVAKNELKDIKSVAAKMGDKSPIGPEDWRYYFEKSKSSKFDLTDDQLRPYFKFENVREGIFYVANQLYGITFTRIDNVPLPHPEAIAFECKDADGSHLGLLFMDMFARPGEKRGGAWCTGYREQSYKDGKKVAPLVAIVGNFSRPNGDEPSLLTPDEAETFFHEFGHSLQSLLQDVKYQGLTGITRDFVELPSQIMEHWVFEPEVLKVYAKHYQTGEIIPTELIEKLDKSGKYGQGFATVEYLAASLLDMDYHVLNAIPENIDPSTFENTVLNKNRGLISQIPSRYKSQYFRHTFGGGYTAGYYSYIWAEVLDCDAYEAFKETGNIFNKEVANKFRREVLQRAGEDDAMTLYINFRGHKPEITPLLKNRGLN